MTIFDIIVGASVLFLAGINIAAAAYRRGWNEGYAASQVDGFAARIRGRGRP